jgi:hypothetical protein
LLRKPQLHLWKDATWRGHRSSYDLASLRVDQRTFTGASFADFQALTNSDVGSCWESLKTGPASVGADETALTELNQRFDFPTGTLP